MASITAISDFAQPPSGMDGAGGNATAKTTDLNLQYDHNFGAVRGGFNARASYMFLHNRTVSLSANLRYSATDMHLSDSDMPGLYSPGDIGLNGIHHTGQLGATAFVRSSLFGKPFTAMGIARAEWGAGGIRRVSAIAMAVSMLKADRKTQFGVGLLILANTSSKIPAFPVFTLRHQFNRQWTLSCYGAMLGIDYTPSRHDLFAVGTDIDVKSFYFQPCTPAMPETCRYAKTSLRPMLKYRRLIITGLHIYLQAGVSVDMSHHVTGVNGSTEYLELHKECTPFLQASANYAF